MVQLTLALLRARKFIDSVRIHVRGGKGGNGIPKYGGVGGKGGDIYVEACSDYGLSDLKQNFPKQRFLAANGKDSKKYNILGHYGQDLIIRCPVGVSAVSDNNRNLGELNEPGDRVLIARGGCGGGPQNNFMGQKGQVLSITLDLKLLADIGFVGFPNAGKSTLLKALSRAQPKIASYPFTTIEPNIGILEYKDFRTISAADLPGLIEGAHCNHGMGHKFLKHCVRTKILLFVIDIDGFRLSPQHQHRTAFETVVFLNRELELYDEELLGKPAILAINKVDQDKDGKKTEELLTQLKNIKDNICNFPDQLKPNNFVTFDAIVPISAMDRFNIPELKKKLRTLIEVYHDKDLNNETQAERDSHSSKESDSVIYV